VHEVEEQDDVKYVDVDPFEIQMYDLKWMNLYPKSLILELIGKMNDLINEH
jgi:hypothetical protein